MTDLSMIICCYWIQIIVTVTLVLCCQSNFYCWNPLSKYLVKVSNGDIRVKFRVDSKDKFSLLLTLYIFSFYTSPTPPPPFPPHTHLPSLKTLQNMSLLATCIGVSSIGFNPLSANITKWSNILKEFVGQFPTNCLSVFDDFVGLVLKGLKR